MAESRGLLLINLGSPAAPTSPAVKAYLNEFLTDRYVIDLPAPVRHVLVRAVITPFRAAKSAAAYGKIWSGTSGSPLVHYSRQFAEGVAARLRGICEVRWAMRYGQPSITSVFNDWRPGELDIVPLYPQYAESSTRTALEMAQAEARRAGVGKTRVLQDFFAEPEFVRTEARLIENSVEAFRPDHILFSFHGLPEHHMTKLHPSNCFQPGCCDGVSEANRMCYRAQCFATARAIQTELKFPKDGFTVSFQSRLGRRPWIKPYTDQIVNELNARGVRRLLVACPSFVADCLETLEEIQIRLREQFRAGGGEDLQLVPSLNADPLWIEGFSRMIKRPDLAWIK